MSATGWQQLIPRAGLFRGDGKYAIDAYSEFMPAPRVGWKAYGDQQPDPKLFDVADPFGWRVPLTPTLVPVLMLPQPPPLYWVAALALIDVPFTLNVSAGQVPAMETTLPSISISSTSTFTFSASTEPFA